ncbi:MAG: HDOD domain-containing protein [Nitrospinae bacterium]|nr:HDOD domain-containing protein [Nitrospinota bacterium]
MLDQQKILSCVDSVPSLSPTVTKIIQIANDSTASANELIQVIKLDPVLTAKILKMINSVYYGMPQQVVSLARAVVLLGINTVKNLALSTAVLGNFKKKGKIGEFNMNLFWEHCLGCAVGSKLLAKSKKVNKLLLEEYFIAGLLHDIGKLALVQFACEEYAKVMIAMEGEAGANELCIEEAVLGTNHAKVGEMIAGKWRLPAPLRESILEHHHPKATGAALNISAAVYIANINCHRKNFGMSYSGSCEYDPLILEKMNFSEAELDTVFLPLEDEIQLARFFLEAA